MPSLISAYRFVWFAVVQSLDSGTAGSSLEVWGAHQESSGGVHLKGRGLWFLLPGQHVAAYNWVYMKTKFEIILSFYGSYTKQIRQTFVAQGIFSRLVSKLCKNWPSVSSLAIALHKHVVSFKDICDAICENPPHGENWKKQALKFVYQ